MNIQLPTKGPKENSTQGVSVQTFEMWVGDKEPGAHVANSQNIIVNDANGIHALSTAGYPALHIAVSKPDGTMDHFYGEISPDLKDLSGAPATGTDVNGATVMANTARFREFIFRNYHTCDVYHCWILMTTPVKV